MAKCFMILALTFAVIHCSTAARNVPAGTGLDDQKNFVAFGGVGGGLGGLGGGIGGLGSGIGGSGDCPDGGAGSLLHP
ncbi:hypothetical protein V6Z11_A07G179400 [Gossypium hirsutum]